MRKLILLLFVASFIVCLYGQSSVSKENQSSTYYSTAERDSILNVLHGDWLDKNYYDELIKTKSPMKALEKSSSLGYLKVSKDEADMNAFNLNMEEDFHQSAFTHFIMEKNDSLKFESKSDIDGCYSIRISRTEKNIIYFYDPFYKKEVKYIKCPPLDSFMNTLLLAGTYCQEGGSSTEKVVFKPDGTIDGLGMLKSYKIGLDIFLGDNDAFSTYYGKQIAWYAYEISGNSLIIYDGVWTSESSIEKGKLLYKLTKIQ